MRHQASLTIACTLLSISNVLAADKSNAHSTADIKTIELAAKPGKPLSAYVGWHCNSLLTTNFSLRRDRHCSADSDADSARELQTKDVLIKDVN